MRGSVIQSGRYGGIRHINLRVEENVHLSKSEEEVEDAETFGGRLKFIVFRNYLMWRKMLRLLVL